jgi:hypothetical protein
LASRVRTSCGHGFAELISQARKKDDMAQPRLRIYNGPGDQNVGTGDHAAESLGGKVTVSLGEVLPLLSDAVRSNRTWLQDFADDDITISADLYEVILAYQHFQRPSA